MSSTPRRTGYAPVNGLALYYEQHGTGQPLILLRGGLGNVAMFGKLLPRLAASRQVIAVICRATAGLPTSTGRCAGNCWPTTSPR